MNCPRFVFKNRDNRVIWLSGVFPCFGVGLLAVLVLDISMFFIPRSVFASDFMVYGLYRALNLGNENENSEKDYYVNMGTKNGVNEGDFLDVIRKSATYDVVSQQLYQDMTFPIAQLKIIHAEPTASIARLEKMLPPEQTPVLSPYAVMVGDIVRLSAMKKQ